MWALDLVLAATDFTQHPSKTVRSNFFTLLRDAWQTRPALQVGAIQPVFWLVLRVMPALTVMFLFNLSEAFGSFALDTAAVGLPAPQSARANIYATCCECQLGTKRVVGMFARI